MEEQSSWLKTLGAVAIVGLVFVTTGYVILVFSRLFLFPKRVKLDHALLMGICCWWLVGSIAFVVHGHQANNVIVFGSMLALLLASMTWFVSLVEAFKGK